MCDLTSVVSRNQEKMVFHEVPSAVEVSGLFIVDHTSCVPVKMIVSHCSEL